MALSKKDVIKHVDDAFARNDVDRFLSFCDDDFVWTMVGSDPIKGKDAVASGWPRGRRNRRTSPLIPWSPKAML